MRDAIDRAIAAIGTIPEPFESTARGTEAAAAITATNALATSLEKVMTELARQ